MADQVETTRPMRFTVVLPAYTAERIETLLAKTGMTRTQLVIMLVDKVYPVVTGEHEEVAA